MDLQEIESEEKPLKKVIKKVSKSKSKMKDKKTKVKKTIKKAKKVKKNKESISNETEKKDNIKEDDNSIIDNNSIIDEDINNDSINVKEDKLYESLDELNNTFDMVFTLLKRGSISRSTLKDVDKKYKLIQKNVLKFNNMIHNEYYRLITTVIKTKRKRVKRGKSNSGLQKKHLVDNKLLQFMNLDEGELVSRVDALRSISSYVKEHNLQIPERRVSFTVEGKLKTLFPDKEELKYTQIMGQLKNFFPKKNELKSNTIQLQV